MLEAPLGGILWVLHAHLPYVPADHETADWFFEALWETYVPLVRALEDLDEEEVPFFLCLSLSPPLVSMLESPSHRRKALEYAERRVRWLEKKKTLPSFRPVQAALEDLHRRYVSSICYWKTTRSLLSKLLKLQRRGRVELLTTALTHAFLPLWKEEPLLLRLQIESALETFQFFLKMQPRGFWLPECGFSENIEVFLRQNSLRYTFVDTHAFLRAAPPPPFGAALPVQGSRGVFFFARDPHAARDIWSRTQGYPANLEYRDFYEDEGWRAPLEELEDLLPGETQRRFTGIKLWAVGRENGRNKPYDPAAARERLLRDARHFLENRRKAAEHLSEVVRKPPVLGAFYDAELFGHWWAEGVDFLKEVFQAMKEYRLGFAKPAEWIKYSQGRTRLLESSWGAGGGADVWMDPSNAWMVPEIYSAFWRLKRFWVTIHESKPMVLQFFSQALWELSLAMASDWAFLVRSGSYREYAAGRVKDHLGAIDRFCRLFPDTTGLKKWSREREKIFPPPLHWKQSIKSIFSEEKDIRSEK